MKVRKLCVVGPSDSGKSTWVSVLLGLTHKEKVATISKEKTFGLSLVNEETQFIFIDEMCTDTLPADQAKIFLQGGMLTVSKKHADPVVIKTNASIYITCNQLPNYGAEQENVMRRLEIFETVSLVDKSLEAPAWIEEHAFEILVWIAMVINGNIGMIPKSERFFEKPIEQFLCVKVKAFCQFNSLKPNKYMKTSNFTKYEGKALVIFVCLFFS